MEISFFENMIKGKRVVICGAGPTLNNYKPIDDAIHIALNRAFLYKKVKFDAMICVDFSAISGVISEMEAYPFGIKLFGEIVDGKPDERAFIPEKILRSDRTVTFNCTGFSWGQAESMEEYRMARRINDSIPFYQSVASVALQLVALSKPKEIVLVGLDFNQDGHFTQQGESIRLQNLHNEIVAKTWGRNEVRRLWKKLAEYITNVSPNTKVTSYNPQTLVGIFKDVFHAEAENRTLNAYIAVKEKSIRLPGKNILPFGDTNLLVNKIRQLKEVVGISQIIVSTDSEEMLKMAEQEGAVPMRRPIKYANETRPYVEFVGWLATNLSGEHVMRCPVTAPLCRPEIYSDAIKKYFEILDMGYDSLTSVKRFQNHVVDENGPINFSTGIDHKGSQDLPVWYEIVNAMDIEPRSVMRTYRFQYGPKVYKYEVDEISSIDIDEKVDYDIARAIYDYWTRHNLWE